MARYIDADKLLIAIQNRHTVRYFAPTKEDLQLMDIFEIINTQPTADVEEVKHGEWFTLDDCANEGVYCSVCHKKVYKKCYANQKLKSNYCPNCGAKMDGGAE